MLRTSFTNRILVAAIGALSALSFSCASLASRSSNRFPTAAMASAFAHRNLNILFVGNSLTGFNNLPGLFLALANQAGKKPKVEAYLKFGQTLAVHLADRDLQNELHTKKFDYVVLQEYSDAPLMNFQLFENDVASFKKSLGPSDTKIVLFENWPYTTAPEGTIDILDGAYEKVARKTGASVIYLGRAMNEAAHSTHSSMYAPNDVKHPSPLATYMNALMFLDFFFERPLPRADSST